MLLEFPTTAHISGPSAHLACITEYAHNLEYLFLQKSVESYAVCTMCLSFKRRLMLSVEAAALPYTKKSSPQLVCSDFLLVETISFMLRPITRIYSFCCFSVLNQILQTVT